MLIALHARQLDITQAQLDRLCIIHTHHSQILFQAIPYNKTRWNDINKEFKWHNLNMGHNDTLPYQFQMVEWN